MKKIRYRLVYNRRNELNTQGCALVQIEAKLNQRNIYMSTDVYLKPQHWDKGNAQVINHPQENDLNAFLFEKIIDLQRIELGMWKRGVQPTLALLREAVKRKAPADMTFTEFAKRSIDNADKKDTTKDNLRSTVKMLDSFRPGTDFTDLTYSYLKDFECYLREKGNSVNTIGKHLRQLRTMINEAINAGYMSIDSYPFRKFKIKQEKGGHEFLTPAELRKLERLSLMNDKEQHILDAFLFCCYCGIRYSDFVKLRSTDIVMLNNEKWLFLTMQKTELDIKLPLELLFDGKALQIMNKYESIEQLADIPCNADTNKILSTIAEKAKLHKHITFHTSRHTCATLLVYQGVPVTTVQRILGHTSIKTTQIYSEVLSDTIVKDLKCVRKRKL